ncbi:MAG: phage holin family protein [Rikenellaceae bacterium]|nr:phage holin family protein [Rikenellaceae bacterium]
MEENKGSVIKQFFTDFFELLNLKIESLTLSIIENSSKMASTIFSVFVFVIFLILAAIFFSAALVWWLTELLGSFILASLLLGGVFLIIALTVYLLRKRLFAGSIVRMFSDMITDILNNFRQK